VLPTISVRLAAALTVVELGMGVGLGMGAPTMFATASSTVVFATI